VTFGVSLGDVQFAATILAKIAITAGNAIVASGTDTVFHALAAIIEAALLFAGNVAHIVIVTALRRGAETSHQRLPFRAVRARFDADAIGDLMDYVVRDFVGHGLPHKMIEILSRDVAIVANEILCRVIIARGLSTEVELYPQRLDVSVREPCARLFQI